MPSSPLSVGKEDLILLNSPMSESAILNAEEDLITFSPTPPATSTSIKQWEESDKPSNFTSLPMDKINKARAQALSQARRKDDPFVDDNHEGHEPDEQQRLLDTVADHSQLVVASSSGHTSKDSEQPNNDSSDVDEWATTYRYDSLMASTTATREALYPPISSTGCVVTINNLPYGISMRDIFARISGGGIRAASLVSLNKAMCAVVTFKESRSAEQFVHASQSFHSEIWTFKVTEEDAHPRKAQISYVPNLDTSKLFNDPLEIPVKPRDSMEIDLATRCLVIPDCSFELIEEIWKELCPTFHLRSAHYMKRFEDIWLSGFHRDCDGRIDSATLHIWYTSVNMAVSTKQAMAYKHWSKNMRYEADPCDEATYVLFFRPSHDASFAWHSNPYHSLLNVCSAGCISELFLTWREITQAVKEARAPPIDDSDWTPPEDTTTCDARRKAILNYRGFDPITLISTCPLDYDSDDEGGVGPPRIDTRIFEAERAAMRKKPLLLRNACLTALVDLATRAPLAFGYSAGTYNTTTTIEDGMDDESQGPCGMSCEQGGDAHDVSTIAPDGQSSKAPDGSSVPVWTDPNKNPAYSEENLPRLKEPTHWYTVSVEEFVACDEFQQKAMGTVFYIPPEGHNSLKKRPWR